MTTPSDPLYGSQWHFDLIGDIEAVWNDYTGDGVSVLVFDDGVESDHPDLDDNYDQGYEYTYGGTDYEGDPSYSYANHGTSVAGIIAGELNGVGGVGVAYDATISAIDFLYTIQNLGALTAFEAAYLEGANFDVVNASLGLPASYIDFDEGYAPGYSGTYGYAESFHDSLETLLETGRDGNGTIAIYAAGNETMNASGSYLTNTRGNIVVGATDSSGDAEYYSNYGVNLLITAPAASVTTDRTGSDGYDSSSDYTSIFGGTSAATPVTAGVVSLILQANEDLGWRDVNEILALSAQQTGSDYGSSGSGYEVGSWASNGATNWNGGGVSYHSSYGYGMIDAFASTRLAEVWDILFDGEYETSANEQTLFLDGASSFETITDGGSGVTSISTAESFEIDSAYVTIGVDSYDMSELSIHLEGPDGSIYMLMDQEYVINSTAGYLTYYEYTFHVNGLHGMDTAGEWSLLAEDNDTDGYTDQFYNFDIEFFGSDYDTDSVVHFTNDYGDLVDEESGRAEISDTDGGTDWLNFAMLDNSLTVRLDTGEMDLGATGSGTITLWDFENIMGGQKRDVLIGDGFDNEIYGNDGNDTLRGNRGNDELNGGNGDDNLYGGFGFDYLYGSDGDDTIYAGKSRDRVEGGAGDDIIDGAQGKDNIFGGAGNDTIDGGTSNDRLSGGKGADILNGGAGNDRIYGGSGSDEFIFMAGNDQDLIYDFSTTQGDTLSIDSNVAISVADFLAFGAITDGNAVFDMGDGDILTVEGISDVNDLNGYVSILA